MTFPKLFSGHRRFFEDRDVLEQAEQTLEEEWGIRIELSFKEAEHQQEKIEDSTLNPVESAALKSSDPLVNKIQTFFNAELRHIHTNIPEKEYHLGKSCNYGDDQVMQDESGT